MEISEVLFNQLESALQSGMEKPVEVAEFFFEKGEGPYDDLSEVSNECEAALKALRLARKGN